MKPAITIIAECQSKNLGDQAIVRSLSDMLNSRYGINPVSFGQVSEFISDKNTHSNKKRGFIHSLSYFISGKNKSLIRWHLLKDKEVFSRHFEIAINKSDLVIVGGGQLIKNNISLFCNKLSLISDLANKFSRPIALIGVGVDKMMDKKSWSLAKNAIARAKILIVRDDISKNRILNSIDRDSNISVLPDVVFALSNDKYVGQFERKISLAINVMNFSTMLKYSEDGFENSIDRILSSICSIVRVNYRIDCNILLFTTGSTDDLEAANAVRTEVQRRTGFDISVYHPKTLDDLLEFLANVDKVLALRMHAGILAYISGCNPICINWDDKVAGVWAVIGEENRVVGLDRITRDDFGEAARNQWQGLAPRSCSQLDELAQFVRNGILEPIEKAVIHSQANGTL